MLRGILTVTTSLNLEKSPAGLRPAPDARFRTILASLICNTSVLYASCFARVKRYVWAGNYFSRARGAHMPDNNERLTMSVPEAGKKYFDLSRDSSYRAAERGEIPTTRIGRLLRVQVRAMERLLQGVERTGSEAT